MGGAALASAVGAAALCAVLPGGQGSAPVPVQVQQSQQARQASNAAPAAEPTVAGFDVRRAWSEEHAGLYAAANPDLRGVPADAWAPVGGLSMLLANRLPSAGGTNTAAAEATVPMPPPMPAARAKETKRRAVARGKPVKIEPQVASLPPQQQSDPGFDFFDKLFGNPDHTADAVLAANPKTAIYDIEKHVVYLPDGEKLEAHSGYGKWMDDPDSVERKNLGVTPPNVYAVSFREKLFHGVRALRLTPVGAGKMYGRDGMLAHSYMLGADGQSNGCVSFKDYDKFLQAYKDGKFKQLIVVRSVKDMSTPSQVASVQAGGV
ncbi:MAG: DUF2778 domain-containing protein [Pseudolabrys sp.]